MIKLSNPICKNRIVFNVDTNLPCTFNIDTKHGDSLLMRISYFIPNTFNIDTKQT